MDFLGYVIAAMAVFGLVFVIGRAKKPAPQKPEKKCCGNSCPCHTEDVT
jgi:hypothetical protein